MSETAVEAPAEAVDPAAARHPHRRGRAARVPAHVEHESTLPRFDVMAALHRADARADDERTVAPAAGLQRQHHHRGRPAGARRPGARARRRPTGASSTSRSPTPAAATSSSWPPTTRHGSNQLFAGLSGADLDALEDLLHRMTRTTDEGHTNEHHHDDRLRSRSTSCGGARRRRHHSAEPARSARTR